MKTVKWVEIARPASKERYRLLSEFMTTAGLANEVHFLEPDFDDARTTLISAKQQFDQIRIGSPFTEALFDPRDDLTATAQVVKASDSWIKDETGKWWPHSLLFDAFISSLAHRIKALDLNSSVLMVGAGGASRAILTALARVGFTKFNITDRHQEKVLVLITDLKRTFFNLKFEFVPQAGITALPGMHSLVVNTTPLVENNEIVRELQFYNFMKEGGAVIDMIMVPPVTPLLEEAEQIGAKIVRGFEIAAEVDAVWVKKAFGISIDLNAYSTALGQKMAEVPIDLTPFRAQ